MSIGLVSKSCLSGAWSASASDALGPAASSRHASWTVQDALGEVCGSSVMPYMLSKAATGMGKLNSIWSRVRCSQMMLLSVMLILCVPVRTVCCPSCIALITADDAYVSVCLAWHSLTSNRLMALWTAHGELSLCHAVAYLILEFVVLAHVFLTLTLLNFASTFIHCAALLKLWLAEHACEQEVLLIGMSQRICMLHITWSCLVTFEAFVNFDMPFCFGESLETWVPLSSFETSICDGRSPLTLFLFLFASLASIFGSHPCDGQCLAAHQCNCDLRNYPIRRLRR